MTPKLRGVCGVVFGLLWLAIPVLAHHSLTAEFDTSKSFSVKGTIAKLEWVNPHVYLYLDVMDQDGNVTLYSFGWAPPGLLRRAGVVRTMFNVGDVVTIDAFPAKDGSKRLGFPKEVHFADGHSIVWGHADNEDK
jgi:hypothetical protein